MEPKNDEIQIIQNEMPVYEQGERASYDIQISTAKRFPRNLAKFNDNVIATVTISEEVAAVCGYTLPRAQKQIQGPSVHLARIMAQYYGNLRVEKRGTMISDKYLTAEAIAFDLESNYAIKVEARRKILDRYGKRYNDDMINTTMLAAMAVAERNAILAVIPKGFVDEAYKAAQQKLTGDLSDEKKLSLARKKMVEIFLKEYDVKEPEILSIFGKTSITQINQEDIASLRGLYRALKDGDTTVDNAFQREKGENENGETVKEKADEFADDKPPKELFDK
jgi:hypothetical protein